MSGELPEFSIRPLANSGTTLHQLRNAVLNAPHEANLVLLRISASPVQFPPICPNCEQPATARLRIERAFLFHVQNDDDSPNDTIQAIDSFDVPFCQACRHQHSAQQAPLSPWTSLKRILFDGQGAGGVLILGIALMFVLSAIERLSLFPLVLASMPLAAGLWLVRGTWDRSRHLALPPPTNVDLALDFTPSLALDFEPNWRAFLFRSSRYADLFSHANIAEFWNPKGMEAQTAAAKRKKDSSRSTIVIGVVLGLGLLWMIWDDYLAPYVLPYFQK